MRGYRTMEKLLREDLAVEELGIKTYGDWAKRFGDKGLKSLFQDLSVDEKGHAQGVISVLRQLEENTLEAVFYCPRCGWVLSLGRSPNPGFRVRCPMCGVTSELVEEEGDFRLEPVDA